MKTTKWNFLSGEIPGMNPFMVGVESYETSMESIRNMTIDFRGILRQRPPIKTVGWVADTAVGGSVYALVPYTYQPSGGAPKSGALAFIQSNNKANWWAVWYPSDQTASVVQSAMQTGALSIVGNLVQDASGVNKALVLSGATYNYVGFDGTTVSVSPVTFTTSNPGRGAITYQGRTLAVKAGTEKTIIGSKIGTPSDFTIGSANDGDGWSVIIDTLGYINNLIPTPQGVIVNCTDSQWILKPGSNGLLSPKSGMSAQKLTTYKADSEFRQVGGDLMFMANGTIHKYLFSNDLQAYKAARILPTVSGKWVEPFDAGGKNYVICSQQSVSGDTSLIIIDMDGPRAVELVSAHPIIKYCGGTDGVFFSTANQIGFSQWYGYAAVPLDWWVSTTSSYATSGITAITWNGSSIASVKVFMLDPDEGYKEIPCVPSGSTVVIQRSDLVTKNPQGSVNLYAGFGLEMGIQTHRIETAGQADGGVAYTIGARKTVSAVGVYTNAVHAVFEAGDATGTDSLQPESVGSTEIRRKRATLSMSPEYSVQATITMDSALNADREISIYGIEIEWDTEAI
jgi:hypothetical protein